jgi:hypothetical protein
VALNPFLLAKIGRHLGSAFMLCPLGWSASPKNIFLVQLCAAFHQKANKRCMTEPRGVVQWSAVRVPANGVKAVWIFACVEQQTGALDASILRRQGECEVPLAAVGGDQQAAKIFKAAKCDCDGQRDAAAALNQRAKRFKPTMKSRRFHCGVRVYAVIA